MSVQTSFVSQADRPAPDARPRLLIVDDDTTLLELLTTFFDDQFVVATNDDPLAALARLRAGERFDLHLYDFCMSNLTGIELLMLTIAQSGTGPVVMMTGHPSSHRRDEALGSGAEAVINKPFDFAQLRDTLMTLYASSKNEDAIDPIESVHRTLIRAVEAKDPTTSGHAVRVRDACRLVATKMGIDESDRKVLLDAALVHDVGKIGVPDAILQKPGPLTKEERVEIEKHPEVGYKILEPLPGMSAVRQCVLEHHERWDGKGYPNRLKGPDISLPGRVLMIVEVFDALSHARPYKEAWSKDRIRDFFRENAGSHFDPNLVPAFDDVLRSDFDRLIAPPSSAS